MRLPASRERWQRTAAILDQVLEAPAAQRDAVLAQTCADDPELRAEVDELLAADAAAEGFLETTAEDWTELLLDAPEPPESTLEGRRLGPYQITRRIGAGGMGVVYEARDTRLHRTVALKLLPPASGHDPEAKQRFVREARAASALDHPNICAIHDVGESDDGRIFIVMAHYQGETLGQRLERGPLPVAEARELAIQIARGLARAHETGIIHRDVKPANVIVTQHGEAKILDFGIARVAGEAGLTRAGETPATPAYLSPERARGEETGALCDVWSLGVVLYEMLAGRRPFPADDPQVVIYQILHHEPEPLEAVRPDVPPALARIAARALAKDPARRYPSVAAMLADLESGHAPPEIPAQKPRRRWLAAVAALGIALGFGGWWALRQTAPPPTPTLAVLRFENLHDDAELDWLRYGLADLVITDLAQSPQLDVLDLLRLDELLGAPPDAGLQPPPLDRLRELSGQVSLVLRGSFVRSEARLRVNFSLQETAAGRVLLRDWVEDAPEKLFALVDEVSRAVRRRLEIAPSVELADSVAEVTTSSYEAWRLYSEARRLAEQSRWEAARPLLEQAIARDEGFALALAELGNLHKNLGDDRLARDSTSRALSHAERLPARQRFFVEGESHSATWSGYAKAIEVYRRGVEQYPGDLGLRNNLASHLAYLELYEPASRELRALIERGDEYGGTYHSAATVEGAQGHFGAGDKLLADYVSRHPDDGYARLARGWYLTEWERYREAAEQLERARALRPDDAVYVGHAWWRLWALREDWGRAATQANAISAASDPYGRWLGEVCTAWTELFGGSSRRADEGFARAAAAFEQPDAHTALSHAWRARLLLQTGRAAEALEVAQRAEHEAPGDWPELEGLFVEALAQQALGRPTEADRIVETLRRRAEAMPNPVQERQLHHLVGRLALARGETERALDELSAAADLLPPRGFWFHWHVLPDHVPVWAALGEAELAAGRQEGAATWWRRVTESGVEHLGHPVAFVRSFYRLGQVYEKLGDTEKAAAAYRRFHDLWHAGDLDREEVESAAAKLRTAL